MTTLFRPKTRLKLFEWASSLRVQIAMKMPHSDEGNLMRVVGLVLWPAATCGLQHCCAVACYHTLPLGGDWV